MQQSLAKKNENSSFLMANRSIQSSPKSDNPPGEGFERRRVRFNVEGKGCFYSTIWVKKVDKKELLNEINNGQNSSTQMLTVPVQRYNVSPLQYCPLQEVVISQEMTKTLSQGSSTVSSYHSYNLLPEKQDTVKETYFAYDKDGFMEFPTKILETEDEDPPIAPSPQSDDHLTSYSYSAGSEFSEQSSQSFDSFAYAELEVPQSYYCTHYNCEKKNVAFRNIISYKKHMLIHAEKTFACDVCGKAFNQNAKLRRHALTHSDEKPFSCDGCGIKFRLKANLNAHMKFHTGEKDFTCTLCGKAFAKRYNLKVHFDRVHPSCGKELCTCGKGCGTGDILVDPVLYRISQETYTDPSTVSLF